MIVIALHRHAQDIRIHRPSCVVHREAQGIFRAQRQDVIGLELSENCSRRKSLRFQQTRLRIRELRGARRGGIDTHQVLPHARTLSIKQPMDRDVGVFGFRREGIAFKPSCGTRSPGDFRHGGAGNKRGIAEAGIDPCKADGAGIWRNSGWVFGLGTTAGQNNKEKSGNPHISPSVKRDGDSAMKGSQ